MNSELKSIIKSAIVPILLIAVMWAVKIIEIHFRLDFSDDGINPRSLKGLLGILTAIFIHADWEHLIANTIPLLITFSITIFFFREFVVSLFFQLWIYTNLWVWAFGMSGTSHIGASGLVYGFVSFLLFSGIIRKNSRLMAISLLMIFLYGGLFWGIFPNFFPGRNISWESHLFGAIIGLILAWFYRKNGLQKEQYHWDEDDDEDNPYWKITDESSNNGTSEKLN